MLLRIPSMRRLSPSPNRLIHGVGRQVVGFVALAVINKFVAPVWGRWVSAGVLALGFGVWYPFSWMAVQVTGLDKHIEDI